jgi:Ca2+-binding RTX toxin-like protein
LFGLRWFLVLGVFCELTQGCVVSPDDEYGSAADEIALDEDVGDLPNLCHGLRHDSGLLQKYKNRGYAVIHWSAGANGTNGPDIIFGTPNADHIFGRGGDDVICAGGGADFVDGGPGQDRIYGEAGNDVLHGRGAGDWIHGDAGDDEIYGDLLDDKLYGDAGNDLLIGGHGADHLYGGPGADWLRGDTNGDALSGGPGNDVASYMTARPSGHGSRGSRTGVFVDLEAGVAIGDGKDPLKGIERVVGSAFDDSVRGQSDFQGAYGNDQCSGSCTGRGAVPGLPFVFVDARPRDTGVIVLGSKGDDDLTFKWKNGKLSVKSNTGQVLHTTAPCYQLAPNFVSCPPGAPLKYLMAWGDDGNDTLEMTSGFPRELTAHLDGGEGDDLLLGADGEDVLFSGRSGKDRLFGGAGDDALISETYREDTHQAFGGGSDKLFGEAGDDQLVSDYPCGGHDYHGGPGFDIAGFARVGDRPIHARMSGKAILSGVCDLSAGTSIASDLEVLEGSKGNDVLIGDEHANVLWGRQGNDTLFGMGGDDVLAGHEGNDEIRGGSGRDTMRGGSGFDRIYAAAGSGNDVDAIISCGVGGGVVKSSEPGDPKPIQCSKASGGSSGSGNGTGSNGSGNGNGSNGSGNGTGSSGGSCVHASHCWCAKDANYKYVACDGYKDIVGTRGFCKLHPKNTKCNDYGSIPGTKKFCKIYPNSKHC